MRFKLGLILFLAVSNTVLGQSRFSPLERQYLLSEEAAIHSKENDLHTSIQPYFIKETKGLYNQDSLRNGIKYPIQRKNFFTKVADNFVNNYLIPIDSGIVSIRATPLFDLELQYDPSKKQQYYRNTRGFLIYGDLGDKFSFYTGFYENQASFPDYINTFIDSNLVIPGQGLTKSFKGDKGQDFGIPFGYICYAPNRYLTVQFGQDKNFIGNGYRSLLRSDNSTNNPFFKIQTSFWHIKYMVLYEQFQDARAESSTVLGTGYPKKFSTTHYLSWKVNKSFDIGLFESIIWQAADSNGYRGFDWAYLNPVIFLRPTEFYNGSADNALMGINVKYQILHNLYTYGQFVLDDMKFDELKKKDSKYPQKYGFQLGARYFNIAKIKGLAAQGEFNYVRPYTYSHRLSLQNYSHYNQSLAHPQNANFIEWVGILDYNKNRWSISNRLVYCTYGADKTAATNYGHNIFADISQYPTYYQGSMDMLQGYKTTLMYNTFTAAYIINPKVNMRLEASFTYRSQKTPDTKDTDKIVGFSFKTALFNKYYDF